MKALAWLAATPLLVALQTQGCRAGSAPESDEPAPRGADALVFSSDRDGPLQLYLLSLPDGVVRRLTRSARDERHPSVSPDGRRVVFESAGDRSSDLYTLELLPDGRPGAVERLTTTGAEREPCFSPDGEHIAFVSARDGDSAIYAVEADGSRPSRLSPPGARDRSPAYSPDGEQIAFVSSVDGARELFVMRADGSGRERLTFERGQASLPCWSPDGRWLVFGSSASTKHDDLVRIAPDGGGRRTLTGSKRAREEFIDRNVASWGARVSPDGERIAFCSIREGDAEIYVMRADGSEERRLTDDPGQDLPPAWLPRRDVGGGSE